MKNYLDLMQKIIDTGIESSDRTGVGTYRLFGEHLVFDLSQGFPATTTKKLAFKSVLAELLFFLQPVPDRRIMQEIQHGNFDPDRFDIWKGNCVDAFNKDNVKFNSYNMGNMYPVQWNRKPHKTMDTVLVRIQEDMDKDYQSKDKVPYDVNSDPLNFDAKRIWNKMMREHRSKGNVSPRWLDYDNFLSDFRCIPNFFEWLHSPEDFELNCTYFGANVYARNTSIFLHKSIKQFIVTDGTEHECVVVDNKRYYNMRAYKNSIYGRINDEPDVVFEKAPHGFIYRPQLFLDQLETLVHDISSVVKDPHHAAGRRLIIDSWNPSWAEDSVLGICHPWVQCFVHEGKLSLMFTMR